MDRRNKDGGFFSIRKTMKGRSRQAEEGMLSIFQKQKEWMRRFLLFLIKGTGEEEEVTELQEGLLFHEQDRKDNSKRRRRSYALHYFLSCRFLCFLFCSYLWSTCPTLAK